MRNVDPAEIPEHGSRHNFVISQVGVKLKRKGEDEVVVKAVIDEGEYKGKTVSTTFKANSHDLHAFAEALGAVLSHYDGDWEAYLTPLLQLKREKRFSASLSVEQFETKRMRGYKYGLTFIDTPTEPPEMHLRRGASQFDR